jgi:peptide/nickel transport system substrate-binding protein
MADVQLGTTEILAKHIQDPNNLTDAFTISETNDLERAPSNPALKAHADWYNKPELKLEPRYNIGTGPYTFSERNPGESVIILRNPKWWRMGKDPLMPAYPEKIIYKVVTDRNTAVVALKNQELDFMEFVPASKFQDEVDTVALPHLVKHPFPVNAYVYIGWNTKSPVFNDKLTRQALSHLVDRDALIKQVSRGLAKKQASVLYPSAAEYDSTLKQIEYSPEKARQLLAQAGWTDSDKNGVLDRVVNGKKVDFQFTFLLNNGNESREQIMLLLADEFKKVGIVTKIKKLDWTVFLDNLRDRKFDAYIGSWVNDPIPSDPYQIWHSSQATNAGSNYVAFVNKRADELMEQNRLEFDAAKRKALMKEFQQIVYDEQPYTMLWLPLYPSVYNKRLQNVHYSYVRPGYNPGQWWVPKAQWRLAAAP